MVLVALADDWRGQLDRGELALLLLLGHTAAVNLVKHELLTHCLADVGLRGLALQCSSPFLKGQR